MSLRIIGILGAKGSGKSELAEALRQVAGPGALVVAFADPLKRAAMLIYGLTEAQVYDPALKEVPIPRLATLEFVEGLTPRNIVQRLGTEVCRVIATDTWVWALRATVGRARAFDGPRIGAPVVALVAVPDVRFANEAQAILDEGGLLVRVLRPGGTSVDTHASETEGARIPVRAEVINDGSLDQLQTAARVVYGWAGGGVARTLPNDGALDDRVLQYRCGLGVISTRSA